MVSVPGSGYVVAGRYRLADQIGRGAMGIVWRGRDQLLDREVAVKQIVLSPLTSQTQAEASYQRTLREARTAARLSHPSVVTVFDVVEEDGAPWIVMELVRARPLDQVIAEDGPLTPAQAAQLGLSLLDALATAHEANVLHRDVKPSNVLIRPDGKAVLTDFGIATVQGDPGLTQAGMVVGTPGFAPPERVRGEAATPASDLWSLGATLYAAVEGRGPFDRAGGSAAIVASVANEPAPRAPSAGPLGPVIDALLRADPAERPGAASTAQMLADAWAAANLPDPARSRLVAGLAGSSGVMRAGVEPTTVTQVMAVSADAHRRGEESWASSSPSGRVGAGAAGAGVPGSGAGLAVSGLAVSGEDPAGADVAESGAGATGAAVAGSAAGPAGSGVASAGGFGAGLAGARRAAASADQAGELAVVGADGTATPSAAAGLDSAAGAGSAARAGAPAGAGSAAGIGVIPDLMATPIFADLKMPDSVATAMESPQLGTSGDGDRSSAPAGQQRAGRSRGNDAGLRRLVRGRRGLVLLVPLVVIAIVVGLTSLVLHGFPTTLAQGLANARPGGGGHSPNSAPSSHGQRPGHHPGSHHQGGARGSQPTPGTPSPSGKPTTKPTPARSPSPSGSPSASPSPSPTPTPNPSPSPTPPPGYAWYSVSAISIGTTAGFRVAAPSLWVMTPGLTTTIRPLGGGVHLAIDMAPFAVQGPVREARHLQAVAILRHTYRQYHLVSILPVTYHGRPAATWTFWWKPGVYSKVIDVSKLLYTAITPAGPQPYILTVAGPASAASWASHVFRVVLRTFQPRL